MQVFEAALVARGSVARSRQPSSRASPARFETDGLAAYIAHGTAEESRKDAGALPLLSYLLDDARRP